MPAKNITKRRIDLRGPSLDLRWAITGAMLIFLNSFVKQIGERKKH